MRIVRTWSFVALLGVVGILYTWATWRYFTLPIPGGNDFLTHYGAWEAYLKLGYSPYSEEAALHTQRAIYGRAALPGEDQNRMVYPFYSILVHGPFVYIDYAVARAIYMTLLQAALLGGVLMMLDVVRWRPKPMMLAGVLAWSLLYYPQARGVILGQYAIFSFFSLAAALYFLARRQDVFAGGLLVLSTIKPTLVFLVVPFLLLQALIRRRWGFIWGFGGVLGALTLGSFVALSTWMSEWLMRIGRYSEYTVGQSPVWLLTHQAIPWLGGAGEVFLAAVLSALMLWAWWMASRSNAKLGESGEFWFHWALGITLVVSNLIVPRSATTNYVLMLAPTLWVFAALDRSPRWGRQVLLATLLISFVGLWWLHFSTIVGNQEQPILFIPMPVVLGVALLAGWRWLLKDSARLKPIFHTDRAALVAEQPA